SAFPYGGPIRRADSVVLVRRAAVRWTGKTLSTLRLPIPLAITRITRRPAQAARPCVAAALAAGAALHRRAGRRVDGEPRAQPLCHLMQRRRLVVHAQVYLFQRFPAGIRLQQSTHPRGGVLSMDSLAVQPRPVSR